MAFDFSGIRGNDTLKAELAGLVHSGQMPHALMFHGKTGSGKLRIALATARMLLCANPSAGDLCGMCSPCKKTAKLSHPDLHFLFPIIGSEYTSDDYVAAWREVIIRHPEIDLQAWLEQGDFESKSKNLQGNLSTRNILNGMHKLSFKSYEGGNKVLVIWLPELMGKEGNRLLKLIEEPPENTYIILVTEQMGAILPTILSRTQLFKVDAYREEEVVDILAEGGIAPEQAQKIAPVVQGNVNEAFKIATSTEDSVDDIWTLPHWAQLAKNNDAGALVKMAAAFQGLNNHHRKQFVKQCSLLVHKAIQTKIHGKAETSYLKPEEIEFIRNFANALEVPQMYALISVLDKAIFYIERNVNASIVFMALTFQFEKYLRISAASTA